MQRGFMMALGFTDTPNRASGSKPTDDRMHKTTPMAAAQAPSSRRRLSGRLCQWKHYLDRLVRH